MSTVFFIPSVVPLLFCTWASLWAHSSNECVWLLTSNSSGYGSLQSSLSWTPLSPLFTLGKPAAMFCEHPIMPATLERSCNEKLEPLAKAAWKDWFCGPFRCLQRWERPNRLWSRTTQPTSFRCLTLPPCDIINIVISCQMEGHFITYQ